MLDAMRDMEDCQRQGMSRKMLVQLLALSSELLAKIASGFGQEPRTNSQELIPRSFMLKSDRWIRKNAPEHGMINPFSEKQVREGVISYGLSPYGYDLRVADEFKIFTNVNWHRRRSQAF